MTYSTERRFLAEPTVRSEQSRGKRILSGMAARFNVLSADLGGWRERLSPGCFRRGLASGADVKFLADHDTGKVLGRVANGTLTVRETADGLAFRCELPETTVAADVYALCLRGDLSEMSFGFRCTDQSWAEESDPEDRGRTVSVRTVKAADVFEISAVCFPAYPQTTVAVDAAARALFPTGLVPAEIRSHARNTQLSEEERFMRQTIRDRAQRLMPNDDRSLQLRLARVLETL